MPRTAPPRDARAYNVGGAFTLVNMPTRRRAALVLALVALAVVPALAQDAPRSPTPRDTKLPARQVDAARGLENPWGLAFLPDGRMLVSERPGRLRIVSRGGELSAPLD